MKNTNRIWSAIIIIFLMASVLASCSRQAPPISPPAETQTVSPPALGQQPQSFDEIPNQSISIEGPPEFQELVNNALSLLKEKTPDHYDDVLRRTKYIKYTPDKPVEDFVAYANVYDKYDDTIYIVQIPKANKYQTIAMAAILVHESEHLLQADLPMEARGLMIENTDLSEYHALLVELDALKYLDPPKYLLDERTAKFREKEKRRPRGFVQFEYESKYQ